MEKLKKKRAQIKKSISKIYNFFTDENAKQSDLKIRIEALENNYKEYKQLQDEIDALCENDQALEKEYAYREEIDDTYFNIKSIWAEKEVKLLEQSNMSAPSCTAHNNSSELASILSAMSATLAKVVSVQTPSTSNNSIGENRLPRIEIPNFDGELSDWTRFKDLFVALVDSKANFSGIEKLEYLQSKLKGEASLPIKHLALNNDNYEVAWKLVKQKYDRPQKIKESYLKLLLHQPHIKNSSFFEIKRFYNNVLESYNALKVLYQDISSWDPILLFLIKEKLDKESITLWCRKQTADKEETFEELLSFLESRVSELEAMEEKDQSFKIKKPNRFSAMAAIIQPCPICLKDHPLFFCQDFKNLDIEKREEIVKRNGICFNCLKEKHFAIECKSGSCKICGSKHNTLLHRDRNQQGIYSGIDKESNNDTSVITINTSQHCTQKATILPTAIIFVRDNTNTLQPCRALIDTGAQASLISESCCQRLYLNKTFDKTMLHGIGDNSCYTKGKVKLEIATNKADKTLMVDSYCLKNLSQLIPTASVVNEKCEFFKNLDLADPLFFKSNKIDIILGVDVFPQVVLGEKVIHPSGSPMALRTIFGFIVLGKVSSELESSITVAHICNGLENQLKNFWEIEECKVNKRYLTPDEEKAEQHFKENFQKLSDGRFMVKLPFKSSNIELGESRTAAMRRLEQMERRFDKNDSLKREFHKFMNEYQQLGHMEMATSNNHQQLYFMPHHAVLKPTSSTTKLRVVFDASCKSSNKTSLNDHLLVGPTIQNELFVILLNFCKFKVGFTADIEKMYRQVVIHPSDRPFQSILWRDSPSDSPKVFNLKTVTYGTAAAPFLATRALQQVAFDCMMEMPNVAYEIINSFYVDDYMSCAPNEETAMTLQKSICEILKNSGFNLRKWSTNSLRLRQSIEPNELSNSPELIIDQSETVKTLGLFWNTETDSFQYSVHFSQYGMSITKRSILSDISKIFDPIGWLSPVVIKLKIFMQRLWLKGLAWDQDLPEGLKTEWFHLQNNVNSITDLRIPRWFNYAPNDIVELHGFADSSEQAYAAVVYIRIKKPNDSISTRILAAKTRVAPVQQISLPRLELCAAHLLTKLMIKIREALRFESVPVFGWTDSTVVLAWLNDHPRRWKTFVANRTAFILDNLPSSHWRHIKSKQNPADLATRGTNSLNMMFENLWWYGPDILQQSEIQQPTEVISDDTTLEERKIINASTLTSCKESMFWERFSSYTKLVRVTALLHRFIDNCKTKKERQSGFISYAEIQRAQKSLIKLAQQEDFATEMLALSTNHELSRSSKLASLTPFIDTEGVMRVGGRLENACIAYDQKHPYILHKDNTLSKLIVREYHVKHLHAGSRQLQYLLSLKYWIPEVMVLIKKVIFQCVTCMRYRQRAYQQRMGDLPRVRVTPASPFLNVGIDYAGPILVRSWKGRGSKKYKSWIAVFVCLSTKAMHLEAVTDLSSQTFLAALRRFVSRRGKPLHIYTDNGTNFVGCNAELKELYQFLKSTYSLMYSELSKEDIQWHFIPPSAPNFGGIWEAGVKSVKYHIKRVLGNACTTYEELNTILCQIECCLNSRPLCSNFQGDVDPLTPAHFLILRPLSSVPDESLLDVNVARLSRWQFMQRLVQQFWKKWSREYLNQLQKRTKWLKKDKNPRIDDIVIIKDDNLPPAQWSIGKIVSVHPGKDGLVRVVSIQTKNGEIKRPITKVCPLLEDD